MRLFPKEQTRANGKIILTDFKKLNPEDFKPLYDYTKEEIRGKLAIYSPDGKLCVNVKMDGWDLVAGVFEILMKESQYTLDQYVKIYKQQYKGIKTFEDWSVTEKDKGRIVNVFAMVAVPYEIKRRQLEKAYYGK